MAQEEGDKLYYSIREVAEHLDVNPSLIRYWEKQFPKLDPKKDRKGNRRFTSKEIRTLERIHFLVKEQGHTIKGAKKKLREKGDEVERTQEALQRLKTLRKRLEEWKQSLSSKGNSDQR